LRYAAPEQLRGEKATAKTDIYSAALVLYEIVAGRGPFDDEGDSHRIAAAHMNKLPLPPSEYTPVPRELDVLLMSALAKNPDARPRDAFSFAASLRNLKRLREEARPRESTDHRVTATAVLSPESTPGLVSASSSPPDSRRVPPERASSTPASFGKTTLVGMPSPTVVPAIAKSAPNAFATTHDVRDRVSTTNSQGTDTLPMPQHGTEALPPRSPAAPGMVPAEGDTEIQWPPERAPMLSDEPQVRSLPVAGPRRRAVWPAIAAVSAAAVAGLVAIGLRPMRGVSSIPGASDPPAAMIAPATRAPSTTFGLPPAPTIPVPAFEDPAVGPTSSASKRVHAPASSSSPASSGPSAQALAPMPHASARGALPASAATDRPGPGF
jgi:hypothetical protein